MAGGVVPVSPRVEQQQPTSGGGARRSGHRQKAAWLPLDIIISEIAARSDPATLVRCAATCCDARRRVAEIADDPDLRGRLRLRVTDRFVLPLLRGYLAGISTYSNLRENTDLYMVDTTAAATRVVKANFTLVKQAIFAADADVTVRSIVPLDSRGGLVLVRATTTTTTTNNTQQRQRLVVCNPAARHCHALPPEPAFQDDYA